MPESTTNYTILDYALSYANRGWSVIPLLPRSKKPAIPWEAYQREHASEEQIRRWWQDNPAYNVGVVTGAVSGLVVLDLDGPEGSESAKKFGLSETPVATTGRGQHWYYRHPGGKLRNAIKLLPGVDLKADGGYVVAPPSIHPSGVQYAWCDCLSPNDVELVSLPAWVLDLLQTRQDGDGKAASLSEPIPEGSRNATLTSLAGTLRRRGYDEATIFAVLQTVNRERCRPPLPEDEVKRIVTSIAKYPAAGRTKFEDDLDPHATDLGNARRFLIAYGPDLHYCHPLQRWFVWDGTSWKEDQTGEVVARAKATVRAMYAEAASEGDDRRRQELARHALKSEAAQKIRAMVELLKTEPGIPVLPGELDRDPWLLNCQNGTLDLRTGELRPHDRRDLITKLAPVAYDPNATCPEWLSFLDRITGGRADLVTYLQRVVGYSLTGLTDERVLFILYGSGANGKSTFLETIALLLGDYAMRTTTETLLARDREGVPNDVARLRGARFVYASEAEEGRRLAEAKIKDVTGGDKIPARFLYGEWFEFCPEFKLFLATNHRPTIRGTDEGIWDRIRLIPFDVRIPESERIPRRELMDRFKSELPGIFAWAVRGCLEWQEHGLGMPTEVAQATGAYRAEMDVLAQFLDECCIVNPLGKAKAGDLYGAYVDWCEANGERPLAQRNFGMRLTERGFEQRRGTGGARWWVGVRLKDHFSSASDVSDGSDVISKLSTRDEIQGGETGNLHHLRHLRHSDGKEVFEI